MQLRLKIAVGICALIGAHFIYSFFTYEDKAIAHMNTWSYVTQYEVSYIHPKDAPVPPKGKLGAFYSCMQTYAGLGSRKITTPITKLSEQLKIKIGDDTEASFSVNGVEAFQFNFMILNNEKEIITGTNNYAINCDIRLLNKPISDMHCEDRLLGNSIRPVCTYRPQGRP